MDFIEIEIPNWEKYNPRSDRTITVWFRFQNDFFSDQKLWRLSDAERLTFLFVLCEASKVQKSAISLSLDYIATQRRRNPKFILEDIRKLTEVGVLNPPGGGRLPDEVLATRQDNTNNTNKQSNAHAGAFALFWKDYPNKKGKTEAEKKFGKLLDTGVLPEILIQARDKYREQLKKDGTEKRFILHGSTFMGRYKEFLDPEYGQAEDFASNAGQPGYRSISQMMADGDIPQESA